MAYERKTIDTWELQLNYGYGWLRRELERRRLRERSNKADSRAD